MPYCPNCNEEFDEGMSACVNCGADLVDSPLYEGEGENLASYVSVFVGSASVAFEVKVQLDNQGFSVYLQGAEEGGEIEADLDEESSLVRILVPVDSAEAALELIEGFALEAGKDSEDPSQPLVEEAAFLDADFSDVDGLEAGDEDLVDPGVFGAKPEPASRPGHPAREKEKSPSEKKKASRAHSKGPGAAKTAGKKTAPPRGEKGKPRTRARKPAKKKTRHVKK